MFDTTSGFSEEEQRSILADIEAVTGKTAPRDIREVRARKRGIGFPLAVNLSALILLAAGVLGLSYLFRMDETVIRQGPGGLGLTERRLIQEIRQENEARINEKEREIAGMLAKLSGLDLEFQDLEAEAEDRIALREAELRQQLEAELEAERNRLIDQNLSEAAIAAQMQLFDEQWIARMNGELASYRENLEAERRTAEANIQRLQAEYRNSLSGLQEERAQILESSRSREASLRAQLEERAGELDLRNEQDQEALSSAQETVRRLSDEREQAVLFDRQMAGLYTAVKNELQEGAPDRAAATLARMGEFLESPALRNNRSVQERKEPYLASIAALTAVVETLGVSVPNFRSQEEIREMEDLQEELAAQAETLADQARQIEALEAQDRARAGTIGQHERTIAALRSEGSARERDLNALRSQTATQAETITTLRSQAAAQAETVATLRSQAAAQAETVTTLRNQAATQAETITTLRSQAATQTETITTLRSQAAAQTETITALRAANTSLADAMANLERAYETATELQQEQR